ncbi:MAG: acetate--CoA ligase [Candidatus Cardinium sp.]|uniref:acetate--CoA ligase n=1 Tax=Cardinium endosymbiont of Dermatophagoides farinae TaxID=2597823 RepID=UPI00118273E9|nr:acetate--CoA ligase [Cardinium endosymbiont of Dermatophagoides farinae]TSJ80790.1 acetate--CoA ligase [Cardinium endosymbiont of Dermatophagoides farinae]UWW96793.1 MAG: acetate--CoA ligase [Candidatus Cardinium sp.]
MKSLKTDLDLNAIYPPSDTIQEKAYVSSLEEYLKRYSASIEDPVQFWKKIAAQFFWKRQPTGPFLSYNFDLKKGPIFTKWMEGGLTNVCYNLVDKPIQEGYGDKIAYYWEGNEPSEQKQITYQALLNAICKCANVLKSLGIQKGDRVAIYMPTTIEAIVVMLSCARIGAVHTVIFTGFSADALAERIIAAKAKLLVTANGTFRGTKFIALKSIATQALIQCKAAGHPLHHCIVFNRLQTTPQTEPIPDIPWDDSIDLAWDTLMAPVSDLCEPEWVDAEDPLFILYTSGSTGKPKGLLHTSGGYLLYAATLFKYAFDYHPEDLFFCSGDLGWITGHTFNVYGALACRSTSVIFDGIPTYPDGGRFWDLIDRYKVTTFYTAPTAIRTLMKLESSYVTNYSRASLRILGSVGEPIDPATWAWFYQVVGESRCPIIDTFWQTETGAPIICPLPGVTPLKPGSATLPFWGILPTIVDDDGVEIIGEGKGHLVIKNPWPGMARTIDGHHERFESTYFKPYNGYYYTGDGARRDADGYFWIIGRTDDMLNSSGHLLSTAEIESALMQHPSVAEAAAVSAPHPIKGESIHCFIVLKDRWLYDHIIESEIKSIIGNRLGAFAIPDLIHPVPALPKVASGKIMRRLLRKIVRQEVHLGDTSTLVDPTIVHQLRKLTQHKVKIF